MNEDGVQIEPTSPAPQSGSTPAPAPMADDGGMSEPEAPHKVINLLDLDEMEAEAPAQNFSPIAEQTQAVPPMPPVPPTPPAVPEQKTAWVTSPIKQAPAPVTPPPAKAPNPFQQKAIRTYESDVADVLAHKRTSTASIAIAESQKKSGEERIGNTATTTDSVMSTADEPSHAGKKLIIIGLSIVLIAAGAGGAYYLYMNSALAPVAPVVQQASAPKSLVPSNSQISISVDNKSGAAIIQAVRAETLKPVKAGMIKEIALVQTTNGQRYRVPAPTMVNTMDFGAPDILNRSLSNDWMFGVYGENDGSNTSFVVASIDYFQNAFKGMLEWESVMPDDLKQYVYSSSNLGVTSAPALSLPVSMLAPATTTSTSTTSPKSASTSTVPIVVPTESQPYVVLRGSFVDRIIHNKDVREFVTSDGKIMFLYSFIDNTKLVVTGSESALIAILDRLEQQSFVR